MNKPCMAMPPALLPPAELQAALVGSGGPGRGPAPVDSPGPALSPLGSAAQRRDPATGSPRTARPSSSFMSPDLYPRRQWCQVSSNRHSD